MTKFLYAAYLPCIQRTVNLHELSFEAYKQLVKLIHNNDDTCIADALENIISNLLKIKVNEITFLDKLIILLTIRAVCVYPDLELTITDPKTQQKYNLQFNINDIIEKITKPSLFSTFNSVSKSYGDLTVVYGIPDCLYFKNEEISIQSTIKKIELNGVDITKHKNLIYSSLPASIYRDVQEHIKNIEKEISELTLLSISLSPHDHNEKIEMIPSLFNNNILDFIKLCYKKDLESLYEIEYFLTSKMHLPYEIVANSTFAELMIYFGFYNEEKKAKEKETSKQFQNPLAAS